MAMQIMYGRVDGKNIEFSDGCKPINVTDILQSIYEDHFSEENFLEQGEEITVDVVKREGLRGLLNDINMKYKELINKLVNTSGTKAKKEIIEELNDLSLLKTMIIEMLLDSADCVLTVS